MRDEYGWLISRETTSLRRYARALVRDPVRADDLVQDCLERAIRKRKQLRSQGSVKSWLFRILYTVYLNGRKTRYSAPLDDPLEETSCVMQANQQQQLECKSILEAIDCLPDDQREAIFLVALEGVSYTEAASILGVEIGTLKSRLSRGRETLRQIHASAEEYAPSQATLRRVK
ncbi:sigma-70 family RNA polymerase sigma factor [Fodinicurvata sediminis]|uniref:sigma-70 family RNA polymerase sigma factor n=1 Tax=Fodinicurvata sediminis TaxID=1121832 RepID=UPI0003B6BDBB|nr:sigma-70 family RNA polymerase sigma factor [Fodinicurvata sediminis]